MQMNRFEPQLPAEAMTTYQVSAPIQTHWRPATCEEVDCPNYILGWRTIVPVDSPQAAYIRQDRSRSALEARSGDGLACFTFGPGQKCFEQHRKRLDREERFTKRGGDWRGNPRGERPIVLTSDQWVDDFGEHQETLADRLERG